MSEKKEGILEKAEKIAAFISERKGIDTRVLDVSERCSWTDCFVISTVSSVAHLQGIARELWGELNDLGLEVNNRHKSPAGDGWELIDCGDIVIHLFSAELREFYGLEKLWSA